MDRETLLLRLAKANRQLAYGKAHLARQEGVIARLDHDGHDTTAAKTVLATLRQTQAAHEQDVQRILQELKTSG